MNHEQWTKLQAATKGHTPGPWLNEMTFHHMAKRTDATIAAAAPDLLAEVERLRGWLDWMRTAYGGDDDDVHVVNAADCALNGAEVPK